MIVVKRAHPPAIAHPILCASQFSEPLWKKVLSSRDKSLADRQTVWFAMEPKLEAIERGNMYDRGV